jgi:hypothetical protein
MPILPVTIEITPYTINISENKAKERLSMNKTSSKT